MAQSMVVAERPVAVDTGGRSAADGNLINRARRIYFDTMVDEWGPRRWIRARIGSLVFLGFLSGPVGATVHSDHSIAYKTGVLALMAAYSAAFLTVIWRNTPRLHANRAPYTIVASLLISVPLLIVSGEQWLPMMTYLTTAMLLFNAKNSRWPYIVVGVPLAGFLIGRYALGDMSSKPLTIAVQALLIGAIQAAFYQQVQAKIELRRVRADLARLAVSEERLRISRDLHDILGQQLSAVSLKAELAARLSRRDPERAAAEMVEVAAVARAALADVRETVAGYRHMSLCGETETARALLTASRVATIVDICELPQPLNVCGAWLIREAVTNVIRHAGASHCE
ncbi:MAG TPA: histidine kinase, partial [Micromonosporaceae bacterium]